MPFGGDDMAHEPFELGRVVDQLGEQVPEVPVEQHLADVEDHALPNHKAPAHAKAPPEASDGVTLACTARTGRTRSEEHTSELQSLMRISYAVFCLKKKQPYN